MSNAVHRDTIVKIIIFFLNEVYAKAIYVFLSLRFIQHWMNNNSYTMYRQNYM
jgi:hypothetical protein